METARFVKMAGIRRGKTVLVDTLLSYVYHIQRYTKFNVW